MTRKHRWLIEIITAFLILIVLLSIFVPRFLRAQRSRTLIYLFQDMDTALCALKAYHNDFGALPVHFERVGVQVPTGTTGPWGAVYGGWTHNDLPKQFLHFVHTGYLAGLPRIFEKNRQAPGGQPAFFFGLFYRYTGHVDGKPAGGLDNAAMMVQWPFASPEAQSRFRERWTHTNVRDGYPPGHLSRAYISYRPERSAHRMIDTSAYYAPTNGIKSAGFVYLDLEKNHSPFGRETPQLEIFDLME